MSTSSTRRSAAKSGGNRRVSTSVLERRKMLLEVKTRRVTTRRTRRRAVWKWTGLLVFWGLFVTGLAFAAQYGLERFFFTNPDYNLARIEIDRTDILQAEEVRQLAGIEVGMNLFRVDLSLAERELARLPEITKVRLRRELPDTVRVELEVRQPVAWVTEPQEELLGPAPPPYLLVDQTGHVYRPRRVLPEFFQLPVISGVRTEALDGGDLLHRQDLREALNLLQTVTFSPETTLGIRAIDISHGYCLEVTSTENARIFFDIGDYPGQLARLQKLLDHCRETGRELEMVNLIPKRNTPVRFVMAQPSIRPEPENSTTAR